MRDPRRLDGSLDQRVEDEGRSVAFADTLPESQRTPFSDDPAENERLRTDCRIDLEQLLAALPEDLRDVSEHLKVASITDTAKARGVQRPSMYYSIKALRKHFSAAGMEVYL